jgi:hypothetical protein
VFQEHDGENLMSVGDGAEEFGGDTGKEFGKGVFEDVGQQPNHNIDSSEEIGRQLDLITPGPPINNDQPPDAETKKFPAGQDERKSPMVNVILIAVFTVGAVLTGAALCLYQSVECCENSSSITGSSLLICDHAEVAQAPTEFSPNSPLDSKPNETLSKASHRGGLERIRTVTEFVVGLGVELAASALMVFLFFNVITRTKTKGASEVDSNHPLLSSQPAKVIYVAIVGASFIFVPLYSDVTWYTSIPISIGVEIVGAVVIFSVLDNVLEELRERNNGIDN